MAPPVGSRMWQGPLIPLELALFWRLLKPCVLSGQARRSTPGLCGHGWRSSAAPHLAAGMPGARWAAVQLARALKPPVRGLAAVEVRMHWLGAEPPSGGPRRSQRLRLAQVLVGCPASVPRAQATSHAAPAAGFLWILAPRSAGKCSPAAPCSCQPRGALQPTQWQGRHQHQRTRPAQMARPQRGCQAFRLPPHLRCQNHTWQPRSS